MSGFRPQGWKKLVKILSSGLLERVASSRWTAPDRSPLCRAPRAVKKLLGLNHLGPEFLIALGHDPNLLPDRNHALRLAAQGASPWYSGDIDGPTTLQMVVSMGWCDVAELLLANDRHWFWTTKWGDTLRRRHLASLWLCVDNEEAEQLLLRHAPLDQMHPLLANPPTALYRLAEGLGQRGLLTSFQWAYSHLPRPIRISLCQNVDVRRWSLRGILFLSERHPELLSQKQDSGRMLVHLLATSVDGQAQMKRMGISSLPLDEEGNTALLAWCVAAYRWNPGVVSRASYGNPENSMHLLPDCHAQACQSLQGLLRFGVDPYWRNLAGNTAWEQAEEDVGFDVWMELRGQRQFDRRWRLEFLQSHLQSLSLSSQTTPASAKPRIPRL